jgi:site-specific recombinase XerD
MIKACPHDTFTGYRDAAILLCLLDKGARANEFLSINLDDINQARGGHSHKVGERAQAAHRLYRQTVKTSPQALSEKPPG